ncbi:MAG: hypothetical protein EPN72_05580 [Nevskiaceae bacterium]|nr:MAG: hypothetical protein EPN63_03615 [Nevskiaceae bacterium]TBR73606.1 MAG: hypothetical protein EPN72_05580 [Nevskiaceae bacterium]
MQVRIEIDVKPEELRRFLGLPDVAGLQDDFIEFMRERVSAASEFDPAAFLRGNLDAIKKYPGVKRLLSAAKVTVSEAEEAVAARTARRSAKRGSPATGKKGKNDA